MNSLTLLQRLKAEQREANQLAQEFLADNDRENYHLEYGKALAYAHACQMVKTDNLLNPGLCAHDGTRLPFNHEV